MLTCYQPCGGDEERHHEKDAGEPVRMLGLGLGEQVRGADVCEYSPGDTGEETEHASPWRREGHGERRCGRDHQPESDGRPHDPGPSDVRGEQHGGEGDPNGYLVNEYPEPDEPGRNDSGLGADAENEAVGEV